MLKLTNLLLAAVLAGSAVPVFAAEALPAAQTAGRGAAVAQELAQLRALAARKVDAKADGRVPAITAPSTTTAAGEPSPPFANAYRAYPPSCLADPLPFQFSGPVWQGNVTLAAADVNYPGQFFSEQVRVTIWRVPCSSPLNGLQNSATLLGIDRLGNSNGNANFYPLFPGVRLSQGGANLKLVRVASEPNTVLSHTEVDVLLINSQTFVLENFASNSSSTAFFDFNEAFTITFYNFFNGDTGQSIIVPAYNPTQATYPTAFQPMPVTGYLSGNWFDPAHSGEGMLVQIFEIPNNHNEYAFSFAWFTYDQNGLPFWLFGNGNVPAGTRGPITISTVYSTGGGFAGNFGASATFNNWGSVSFSFPNCGTMDFNYNGSAAPVQGPVGSGTRRWINPLAINGLRCDL